MTKKIEWCESPLSLCITDTILKNKESASVREPVHKEAALKNYRPMRLYAVRRS